MESVNLTGIKYVVFADFGHDGASTDTFIDEESARIFADALIQEGDYVSLYIGPIGKGSELYGEPSGLAKYYR